MWYILLLCHVGKNGKRQQTTKSTNIQHIEKRNSSNCGNKTTSPQIERGDNGTITATSGSDNKNNVSGSKTMTTISIKSDSTATPATETTLVMTTMTLSAIEMNRQ